MELRDYGVYSGKFFGEAGAARVIGVLQPKGFVDEQDRERTLRDLDGLGHYVDPSTLVPIRDIERGLVDVQEQAGSVRAKVLRAAEKMITGDRNKAYGSPAQNFQDTAKIWTVQLGHKLQPGVVIDAGEVAALMIGLKLARIKASPKLDNWEDIAGYAGCGAEADTETGKLDTDSGM